MGRQRALLQYTEIRAPYAGVVTERNVVRGDFVQPAGNTTAKPLLAVARTDLMRVFVNVPEMDAASVEAGRTGYVGVPALGQPDRTVEGKVARTGWALGANRTLHTEIDLPNTDGRLRPGMYVTGHVVLQERRDVLVIPRSAVVTSGKASACWTVRDGRAVRTPIALGLQVEGEVEVLSGLSGAEAVIQSPPGSLQEGQAVEVAGPRQR